ncbi:MAG TPA: alpha-E domain-containing protein, partial [Solirubrobacteraceae bacterium]|nr:alpha-E domain-containing protein [Solirubrobacteraceae bacterium]
MLARIAHELFWLGRNLGRAEHTARMLDGVFHAELQGRPEDPSGVNLSWDALLAIMGSSVPEGGMASRDVTIASLTQDSGNVNSVASCVGRARNGARALRDVISAEMWEAINTFHLELGDQRVSSGPYAFVSYVKARSALFWGVAAR